MLAPFHLAIPVGNLDAARRFYRDTLEFNEGRSSDDWVDFDFFGHQFVIHYKPKTADDAVHRNVVDGKAVPVPHFGVVLEWDTFHAFAKALTTKSIDFVIEPYMRFKGKVGEQATMFFYDPCGNAIGFKNFKNMNQLFAS